MVVCGRYMKKDSVLIIFGDNLPENIQVSLNNYDVVIAPRKLHGEIKILSDKLLSLEDYLIAGSIYDASALAEELSHLNFPDGQRISKSSVYEGYELWWIHYENLFTRYCLPFTQLKKLLEYAKSFDNVYLFNAPHRGLISCYFEGYGNTVSYCEKGARDTRPILPIGMMLQIILTLFFIPLLLIQRKSVMVFTGDKFETSKDYDFRMRLVYEELRKRGIPFMEFVRSLEPSKSIIQHALKRMRPVIYSEAITFMGRFISMAMGGHRRARREIDQRLLNVMGGGEIKFKTLVATQYLLTVYDDIWAIRIARWILRVIGVRSAFITAACERNFHAVLACKLNSVPTVGILHGAQSRYYNLYDFTPGFDGEKILSVDKYGVWSEWWKEYYTKYSKAYRPEQLFVSGPMRPMQKSTQEAVSAEIDTQKKKVLFVSEVVAVPEEVIPYLDTLMANDNFAVYIKFRSSHDIFEMWLKNNRPDILDRLSKERILNGTMSDAIAVCDVVVGCQSTGVIEATMQKKPFVFFNTMKWGDYFDMKSFDTRYNFFALNPKELQKYIKESESIPTEVLVAIKERFFGDQFQNGSKWVVDELERLLKEDN